MNYKKSGMILLAVGLLGGMIGYAYRRWLAPPLASVDHQSQRHIAEPGGAKVLARYTVTNVGGGVLRLRDATTSCGCSVAAIRPDRLGHGQRGVVIVEGSPPSAGEKSVLIAVATNDLKHPQISLNLVMVGSTKPPFVNGTSGSVRFGTIHPASVPEKFWIETIELKGQSPWIAGVKANIPGLRVRVDTMEELPYASQAVVRQYRYSASFDSLPEPGDIVGELTVFGPKVDSIAIARLPVLGIVRPAVYASPPTLFANVDANAPPPKLTLHLATADAHRELDARLAPGSPSVIDVREVARDGGRIVFEVSPRGDLDRSMSSALIFDTNQPAAARVHVPIVLRRSGR